MTSKGKNIITCFIITLLIVFIYIPLRTGFLEQQFIKSIILTSDKVILSISSFEKNIKLQDKNLEKFFKVIKDKYPAVALIAAADKNNKVLKAGKSDKYIKSNSTFDTIIDNFVRNEFKISKKNDFVIRYYDQNRFYIFINNIAGGKLLLVYPFKLSIKLIVQLILEILLISIFSIIVTALIFIKINKRPKTSDEVAVGFIKKDVIKKSKPKKEFKKENEILRENTDETKQPDKLNLNLDYLSGYVYDLFNYISETYRAESVSFYLLSEDQSKLNKIFELKGKALIKIDDMEFNIIQVNRELIDELKNSSIILQEKGNKVTIPILYRNVLFGVLYVYRDKAFKGPEINDISLQIKNIAKPLGEHILLADVMNNEK